MNGNQVKVAVRSVYGAPVIYPVCERAKLLAELDGEPIGKKLMCDSFPNCRPVRRHSEGAKHD